jgi:hypothetical protein
MVIYQKSQARKLPRPVQDFLRHKFNLPTEYPGILRYLENAGGDGENQTTSISIFSPIRAREHRLNIKTAADLGRYPEMVLFKGNIDSQGGIDIADHRGPVWHGRNERPEKS